MNLVLVASATYLAREGVPQTPQELKRHKLIVRRFLGGKASPWNFRAADGSITTLDLDAAVLTLSAPEAMAEAASLGLGVAQVGVHHAWRYLAAGDLKVVLFGSHDPGSYEMVMQFPHRVLMAPRVRATIDYLLAAFAQDEALHVPLDALNDYAT